jgi:hypothetical protein
MSVYGYSNLSPEEFKNASKSGGGLSFFSPIHKATKGLGDAYNDITGVTTAREAEKIQREALGEAQQFQQQQFEQAQGYLNPYYEAGQSDYNTLRGNILSGAYTPEQFDAGRTGLRSFNYGKQQGERPPALMDYSGAPVSEIGYAGQQPDAFIYGGQGQSGTLDYSGTPASQLNYAGGPVDKSIESYMKDDPSLAWQQEQMEKMIDRKAASQGRWGGGGTAREMLRETAGLLSQDYGNRFNRAQAERAADVGTERDAYGRSLTQFDIGRQAEQEGYGRALTGLGLKNLAEQSGYDRTVGKYGMDVAREQDAYGRAVTGADFRRAGEQEMYDRGRTGYQDAVSREQSLYDRALMSNQLGNAMQADRYNRNLTAYGLENERMQNQLSQMQGLGNLGPQMATALGNMAIGQGASMADLAIQQGNAAAASRMAQGSPLSNLLNLAGQGMDIYNQGSNLYQSNKGGK